MIFCPFQKYQFTFNFLNLSMEINTRKKMCVRFPELTRIFLPKVVTTFLLAWGLENLQFRQFIFVIAAAVVSSVIAT